jgi:hypothetical protein
MTSLCVIFSVILAVNADNKPVCDLKMFGGSDKGKEAVTACKAIDVL